MSEKNLLKNVYLFQNLNEADLERVNSIAELVVYAAGDKIFTQGSEATALYIIKFGSVRIIQSIESDEKVEIAILGSGSHFGEMAFLDGEPRSAQVASIESSEVVKINYSKLKTLLETDNMISTSFYKSLSRFLIGRLRVTTIDLSFAREKNLSHF